MAHQSLYRRYRPRRFDEVRGQDHVVRALRNAVATDTVGHAYLFSGPRGTGKTSTARILAKALNCDHLSEGEPCCECGPCTEMEAGRSFDLFELDAASNNGVDAIRDLVERAAVGSPGRTKVYILDEVHMLSTAASNALLKTLEEPPGHVCFVLATTDPQKVLPTIRSRTQHYEFQLLSAQELSDYVHWIARDAPLDIDDASVAHVVREGRGSARDTLSALDQVVAAGGVVVRELPVDRLMQALADADSGAAVLAVSDALTLGNDPRVLGERLLAELRDAFLLSLGVEVAHLVDGDAQRLRRWADALGTPTLTRATEAIGGALVDMRNAADPRVPLDVALVRLCVPRVAPTPDGESGAGSAVLADLVRRIEVLERSQRQGSPPSPAPSTGPAPSTAPASESGRDGGDSNAGDGGGPAAARAALGAVRAARAQNERTTAGSRSAAPERTAGAGRPPAPPAPSVPRPQEDHAGPVGDPVGAVPVVPATAPVTTAVGPPDRDALTLAFGDVVLPGLKGVAKAVYGSGRFVAVTDRGAVFQLENGPTRDRAERFRPEVEAMLSSHFGTPLTLLLADATEPGHLGGTGAGGGAPRPGRPPSDPTADPTTLDRRPVAAVEVAAVEVAAEPVDDEESIIVDVHDLEDADVASTGVEKLTRAFPGAVLVDGPDDAS